MSVEKNNNELVQLGVELLHPIKVGDYWQGDVAAVLVSDKGNIYTGVCMDVGSGAGFCAERAAIAQMFANNEHKIKRIVAVWNNNPEKDVHVLAPCGVCRQFMLETSEDALDIDVILSKGRVKKLSELLPEHEWPEKETTSLAL